MGVPGTVPKNRGKSRKSPQAQIEYLKHLLRSACMTLDEYYPDVMSNRVKEWWMTQKSIERDRRVEASEAGVADMAVMTILDMGGDDGAGGEGTTVGAYECGGGA